MQPPLRAVNRMDSRAQRERGVGVTVGGPLAWNAASAGVLMGRVGCCNQLCQVLFCVHLKATHFT